MKRNYVKIAVVAIAVVAIVFLFVKYMPSITMQDVVMWYRDNLNYGTITLLMAIESSFIPFPSEIVIPPAAYFSAHNGDLNIVLIVLFAALINYVLALFVGRPLIHSFAESRIGHMCMLSSEKVNKAEVYFEKHGAVSTFLGRLIPAVRQLISIPAGLSRMSILPFVLYTAFGAGIWNSVLAVLGYWLSLFVPEKDLFMQIEHYNKYLTMAGYALAGCIVIYILYHIFKNNKKK